MPNYPARHANYDTKNVMDDERNGAIRLGIYWHDDDYTLFWINSAVPPSVEEVVDFTLRHPGVAMELYERDITPEDFAAVWDARRRLRVQEALAGVPPVVGSLTEGGSEDDVDKATVAVLLPPDWKELSARKSIVALIHKSERIRKRDVYAVGWQGDEDEILQVVMHKRRGAERLVKWIDRQRGEGIWEVYAERSN